MDTITINYLILAANCLVGLLLIYRQIKFYYEIEQVLPAFEDLKESVKFQVELQDRITEKMKSVNDLLAKKLTNEGVDNGSNE